MPLAPGDDEQKTGGTHSHWDIGGDYIHKMIVNNYLNFFIRIKTEKVNHISFECYLILFYLQNIAI
jgi:hypothetical protein